MKATLRYLSCRVRQIDGRGPRYANPSSAASPSDAACPGTCQAGKASSGCRTHSRIPPIPRVPVPQGSCKDRERLQSWCCRGNRGFSRSSSSMSVSRGGRTSRGLPYSCCVGLIGTFNSPSDGESPGLVRLGAGPGLKTQDEPYTGRRIFNETTPSRRVARAHWPC